MCGQESISLQIVRDAARETVLASVHFDHNPVGKAYEVDNVCPDGSLATKVIAELF